MKPDQIYYHSPLGMILAEASPEGIRSLSFVNDPAPGAPVCQTKNSLLDETIRQLDEYFNGNLQKFDLPLALEGTIFQQQVWQELSEIPYGTTLSYGQLASRLGSEKLTRAVGMANGKNPVAIVVPCHRVIGTNGRLTGYAGGLWRKQWLLEHEQKLLALF